MPVTDGWSQAKLLSNLNDDTYILITLSCDLSTSCLSLQSYYMILSTMINHKQIYYSNFIISNQCILLFDFSAFCFVKLLPFGRGTWSTTHYSRNQYMGSIWAPGAQEGNWSSQLSWGSEADHLHYDRAWCWGWSDNRRIINLLC